MTGTLLRALDGCLEPSQCHEACAVYNFHGADGDLDHLPTFTQLATAELLRDSPCGCVHTCANTLVHTGTCMPHRMPSSLGGFRSFLRGA